MTNIVSLALAFVVMEGASINLNLTEDLLQDCSSYTDDFWDIYDNHFLLVDHLTIHVLQIDTYKSEVNQYTDNFLEILSWYDYPVALEIEESFLKQSPLNIERSINFRDVYDYVNLHQKLEPIDYDELLQIKRLSSDSLKGYFIIVWDVETLHLFLDENSTLVIPEERATYALQFVFTSPELCDHIRNHIDNILRRFWREYNVVNIVAQTPCCCDTTQVYIHRPFVKFNESWGITQNYNFDDIIENFRVITNPLDNFNQFPLDVNIFLKEPTAVPQLPKLLKGSPIYKSLSSSKGYAGVDGLILGTLSEYLNFNVNLVGESSRNFFGAQLPNGTYTPGAMKYVVDRKIVYSANGRYLINYDDSAIEFTVPHTAEENCVVVPKAHKIPIWMSLFRCFNQQGWILIIVVCVASTVIWYYIGPTKIVQKVSWTTFSYLFGIPERHKPRVPQFVFLTACMFFNVVILGTIQGSMFKTFTTTTHYPDINTFEELDKSNLPLQSPIWNFIKDDTPLLQNLKKKTIHNSPDGYQQLAVHKNFSLTDSKSSAKFHIKSQYVDDDGYPLFHIVNECFSTFLMAHIVPKGSAFLTVFNNVITKMIESGLTKKWDKDIVDSLVVEKMTSLSRKRKKMRAFSLYDLQGAFYVIFLGYAGSVALFLYEVWSGRCTGDGNT